MKFKNLEFNNKTQDLEYGLINLNSKVKIIAYSKIGGVVILAALLYSQIMSSVDNSNLRSALVKNGKASPIMSYFYSDFKDDKKELTKLYDGLNAKSIELKKSGSQNSSQSLRYSYNDFLSAMTEAQFNAEIEGTEPYNKFMFYYYLKLLADTNKTILLNGTEYSVLEISKKVSAVDKTKAYELLEKPLQSLDFLANREIGKKALHEFALYQSQITLIKALSLNEQTFKKMLYPKVKAGARTFQLVMGDRGVELDISKLFSAQYETSRASELQKIEAIRAEAQSKQAEITAELIKISSQITLINDTINLIDGLLRNIDKYDEISSKIEQNLETLGV